MQVRRRTIGALGNHVIGGMHIHTLRGKPVKCKNLRFGHLASTCAWEPSLAPYGIDPAFKPSSSQYQPELDNTNEKVRLFNCTKLLEEGLYPAPGMRMLDQAHVLDQTACQSTFRSVGSMVSYNVSYRNSHLDKDEIGNVAPFCAQLYNAFRDPWAFQPLAVRGFRDGFSVWVDVQNNEASASAVMQFIRDGEFLDTSTQQLSTSMIAYNPLLHYLAKATTEFTFQPSGLVDVEFQVNVMKVGGMCTCTTCWCTTQRRSWELGCRYAFIQHGKT
jgi:hypothetical protein